MPVLQSLSWGFNERVSESMSKFLDLKRNKGKSLNKPKPVEEEVELSTADPALLAEEDLSNLLDTLNEPKVEVVREVEVVEVELDVVVIEVVVELDVDVVDVVVELEVVVVEVEVVVAPEKGTSVLKVAELLFVKVFPLPVTSVKSSSNLQPAIIWSSLELLSEPLPEL